MIRWNLSEGGEREDEVNWTQLPFGGRSVPWVVLYPCEPCSNLGWFVLDQSYSIYNYIHAFVQLDSPALFTMGRAQARASVPPSHIRANINPQSVRNQPAGECIPPLSLAAIGSQSWPFGWIYLFLSHWLYSVEFTQPQVEARQNIIIKKN